MIAERAHVRCPNCNARDAPASNTEAVTGKLRGIAFRGGAAPGPTLACAVPEAVLRISSTALNGLAAGIVLYEQAL